MELFSEPMALHQMNSQFPEVIEGLSSMGAGMTSAGSSRSEGIFSLKQGPDNRLLQGSGVSWTACQISCIKNSTKVNSELLDFLSSLIQVSIKLDVLIWLHNLILLHNHNVTLLRSRCYYWRGLLKMSLHLQCPWRDVDALGEMKRRLVPEYLSSSSQLSVQPPRGSARAGYMGRGL